MNGKKLSFKEFLGNSERWVWSNVARQTVPKTTAPETYYRRR